MDRRATLIGAFVVVVGALSVGAWAKPKTQKPASDKPAMTLTAIDRGERQIHVALRGFKKAPPGNLFAMTDDRGRHYIAQAVRCKPPEDKPLDKALDCALEIPDGYERHPLVSLELHLRGLHSRTIAVPKDVVERVWQASVDAADAVDGGTSDAAP
jgi:hypothetical protein